MEMVFFRLLFGGGGGGGGIRNGREANVCRQMCVCMEINTTSRARITLFKKEKNK